MVSDFFSTAIEKNFAAIEHSRTEDNDYGHGRIESRTCYSVPLPDYLKDFRKEWVDLKSWLALYLLVTLIMLLHRNDVIILARLRLMPLKLIMQSVLIGTLKMRCIG